MTQGFQTPHPPKAQIMLVEDEIIVAADLTARLNEMGYTVCAHSTTGEGAIEMASRYRPDLVLMDIFLQGRMDGIEAAGEIHKNYQVPVIYLTAFSEDNIIERAKFTEPFAYVLKPYQTRDLRTAIEMALYKAGMEARVRESEAKYRSLFYDSPIALLEQDCSELKHHLDGLRRTGVEDFRTFFTEDVDRVVEAMNKVRVLDVNNTALALMGVGSRDAFLAGLLKFVPKEYREQDREVLIALAEGKYVFEGEFMIPDRRGVTKYAAYRFSVAPGYEHTLGKVFVSMLDITERKQVEKERETLIAELQKALAEVKTLSGFLPICSKCKKIRDDEGYWQQVEKYVEDRSYAQFSHSICPQCARELYPDLYRE